MENNRASYLKKEENGTSIVFSASRIFTLCSVLILALVLVGKLMREREKERERKGERERREREIEILILFRNVPV